MADTLDEVAELAGVSRSTASRVINNHSNVSEEARKKVKEAIRQSGFRPNPVARGLAKNETRILGLVVPRPVEDFFLDPFFPPLTKGIAETCARFGYQVMHSLPQNSRDKDSLYKELTSRGFFDGILVTAAQVDDSIFFELLDSNLPFVAIGRHPDKRVDYVSIANKEGARQATNHLIEKGHERIAHISGDLDKISGKDRLTGYKEALKTAGLSVDEKLIEEGDWTTEAGAVAINKLLPKSPTAVFVAGDRMAVGALRSVKNAGLDIPEDMAIVGFDDDPIATVVTPRLTTVKHPMFEEGKLAAELLIKSIKREVPETPSERRIVLDTELVVRESS